MREQSRHAAHEPDQREGAQARRARALRVVALPPPALEADQKPDRERGAEPEEGVEGVHGRRIMTRER